ncbi:MAG: GH3 auxin-responsive promoter family protein [Chitinophagales bacterium]
MFFYPLVHWFLKQRMNQIQSWMEYPMDSQLGIFNYLVQSARDTEWGRSFDYASIKSPDQFRERIPVQDYDSLKPFIQRMMNGEQNILWSSPVKWFSKSSGTTSDRSKFIPMSKESIEDCHFKGGIDMIASYCAANPETKLLSGKGVILGGSHHLNNSGSSTASGDLSAVLMQNMSFFAQWFRAPDLNIALMDDWERKLDAIARATMDEDVSNISGVPTWTLLTVKKVLELKGKDNLAEVWPNLELYMHGGVNFTPYKNEFTSLIRSDKMHYYQTYNASEGFFAFQFGLDDDDMLLHLGNGIFFEFIPESQFGNENPRTVLLHEVIPGVNYGMVISTNGGLWRYNVGDTIRFTSVRPFKIQVTGRLKHFINAFGEEVIIDNAERALAEACRQTNAEVSDYTVAPVYLTAQHRGSHEWLIEFSRVPFDINVFTRVLDESLRRINSDYDAKRQHDLALELPIVHSLPSQTFYHWLKSKNKLGGQNKVPRLSNDRKYADEILQQLFARGT